MAAVLGKDPAAYERERDGFLRELRQFHESRGTPFRRAPILNGQEVDLYLLYSLVTAQGGWIKVNSKSGWSELYEHFRLPGRCINGSVALKQLYLRFLDRWEKVHFLGEEAERGSDDDEESRHKRWSARALHSVPLTYNHAQHNVTDAARKEFLSTDLYPASVYDRLALSLLAPLPNEQDFAVNVCTLLSNDGRHNLKLSRHPRLVDFLLGHAGVFSHPMVKTVVGDCYQTVRKRPFGDFWKTTTSGDDSDADDLMDADFECASESNNSESNDSEVICDSETPESSLFNTERIHGTQDYVGQRILQIATIFRNLSFTDENVPILSRNETFIRFLILCLNSKYSSLKNLGFDVLGNVATEFRLSTESNVTRKLHLFPGSSPKFTHFYPKYTNLAGGDLQLTQITALLLRIIFKHLNSYDRNSIIASLDALNKLSQNELNEEILIRTLKYNIYRKICSFLTVNDIMLLIYTLECLYSLSSLGETSCNHIANNRGIVDTLVSLVTVEGKSYGPKACIGMKLVETVTGMSSAAAAASSGTPSATATAVGGASPSTSSLGSIGGGPGPPATPISGVLTVVTGSSASATTPTIVNNNNNKIAIEKVNQQSMGVQQRIAPSAPTTPVVQQTLQRTASVISAASAVPSSTAGGASLVTIAQQHQHQQTIQENEQFALSWLRATYEPSDGCRVNHQELYKHYINYCAKIGRRGVIAPLHFPRCVRSVFGGTVGPNPAKPPTPGEPQFYDGIKTRSQPLIIHQPVNPPPPSVSPSTTTAKPSSSSSAVVTTTTTTTKKPKLSPAVSTVVTIDSNGDTPPASPASPILKAQLSKSQVSAHPHLSQALLGTGGKEQQQQQQQPQQQPGSSEKQSNTSLIKSLLASKVTTTTADVSMRSAVAVDTQVAARQEQRLLSQQQLNNQQTTPLNDKSANKIVETPKGCRPNGVRQLLFSEAEDPDKSKSQPEQQLPPLIPLMSQKPFKSFGIKSEKTEEIDDSDSTGNNSLSSGEKITFGGISSENENSLTSFEGLININGIPNLGNLNEDSSESNSNLINDASNKKKPLMLADLLEKKVEKDDLLMKNGGLFLGKNEKSVDLVENHFEKILEETNFEKEPNLKRKLSETEEDSEGPEAKRPRNVNGLDSHGDAQKINNTKKTETKENPTEKVSTAAAKLFADFAADILEDEEIDEEYMQPVKETATATTTPNVIQPSAQTTVVSAAVTTASTNQIFVENSTSGQQMALITATTQQANRQIIVSQGHQQRAPNQIILQQTNAGQILLSQGLQTVLLAQAAQQQLANTKTIIILQQQPPTSTAIGPAGGNGGGVVVATSQPQLQLQQKVVMATAAQMQRPVIQSVATVGSSGGNSSNCAVTSGAGGGGGVGKVRAKIVRDLTTPFVCEWGDCQIETKFRSANHVYMHVCQAHVPECSSEEVTCQWDRCDNTKRKKFSLMTHLSDKHCNLEAMRASLHRRKQSQTSGKSEASSPTPAAAPPPPHPGYAPDAALHAIKRHALEFVNPKELQDDNEGPVTKSIRLTASLILRNLVIYSGNCRRYLKRHEAHLATVALSNVESSRTIAQVLYDLNESHGLQR